MKKKLSVLNLLSVILVIVVNYLSQTMRFNETTIGEVSNKYFNLFTPAGYAFAIWGLIFLALFLYGIHQIRMAFISKKKSTYIEETGYWFIIANMLNCAWVFVFAFDYTGMSVLIMLGILFSLLQIVRHTNMAKVPATKMTIIFGWLPIGIYSGWIAVATIANFSAYFAKLGWNGAPLSEEAWTIIMIIIAILVNLFMLTKRNMREFALVGVWALFAIYIRHNDNLDSIAYTSVAGSTILLTAITVHAYQTRKTNPFFNF
ncbi:MAG: tryptophan-rich sensory protein [Flavobacteriaceae bacterium]